MVPAVLEEPFASAKSKPKDSKLLLTWFSTTRLSSVTSSMKPPPVEDIWLLIIVTSIVTWTLYVTMVDIMKVSCVI